MRHVSTIRTSRLKWLSVDGLFGTNVLEEDSGVQVVLFNIGPQVQLHWGPGAEGAPATPGVSPGSCGSFLEYVYESCAVGSVTDWLWSD